MSFEAVDSVVSCDFVHDQNTAAVVSRNMRGVVSSVDVFSAHVPPSETGLEIIKAALVANLIGKFRNSVAMNIDFTLDPRSVEFLNALNNEIIGDLPNSQPTVLNVRNTEEVHVDTPIVVPNTVLLGNSGGRDSFVASDLLRSADFNVVDYRIDYDRTYPSRTSDYSTYSHDVFAGNTDSTYEPFDIPLTHFAPLWNVGDRVPEHIAIGHSFDVLGFKSNRRRAPFESPKSMELHQKYLDAMLGNAPSFTYPISTMTTYSIFEYIRRKFGIKTLESKLSCWDTSSDTDCGHCDKCQRIKLAGSAMHLPNYEYLRGSPQVIDNHGYLFGNPAYDDLVHSYGKDAMAESQLFSPSLPFSDKVASLLMSMGFHQYRVLDDITADQPLTLNKNVHNIPSRLGIDYSTLPDSRMHGNSRLLPYEQYFDRAVPVLAAHGEIPRYVDGLGWKYSRVADGPRLEVPDSLLFRQFFKQK